MTGKGEGEGWIEELVQVCCSLLTSSQWPQVEGKAIPASVLINLHSALWFDLRASQHNQWGCTDQAFKG